MFTPDSRPPLPPPAGRDETGGIPVDPHRLWRALARARWVVAAFAAGGGLAGAVVAKVAVARTYEASSVLAWEGASAESGDAGSGDRELRSIAEGTKTAKNLAEIRGRLGEATTLAALGRRVEVRTKKDSNLLVLAATGEAPEEAADLAQAVVDVFLEHRLVVERQRLEEDVVRRAANLEAAESNLVGVRARFDEFRTENGLLDLPVERQAALDHLARLRSEADLARAKADGSRAEVATFEEAARDQSAIAVLAEKEIRPDRKRLAEARAELAGLLGSFDAQHPRVLAIHAEIDALAGAPEDGSRVARAERTIGRNPHWEALHEGLAEAKAAANEAQTREATFEELAARAEDHLTKLTTVEGQAARLLSEVKVGERHVAELQTLHAMARDLARAPRSGFRLLAPPQVPDLPTKSARRLVALLGAPVGLLLAAVFVLLREVARARLATAREAAFWGRCPVVASSTWPREPGAMEELAQDLLAEFGGSVATSVVGVDAESARSARAIVEAVGRLTPVPKRGSRNARGAWVTGELGDTAAGRRRAVRSARRVLVVATAGSTSFLTLRAFLASLGARGAVAVVLVAVGKELAMLPDQAGNVAAFVAPPERGPRTSA